MAIESTTSNGYHVFRIRDDLGLQSNIAELEDLITAILEADDLPVAVSFTENSHLFSSTIAVLIRCVSLVEDKGQKLTLVVPNESIMSSLMVLGLKDLVVVCRSEDELGGQ
jgi:anti-anti-sigma factor